MMFRAWVFATLPIAAFVYFAVGGTVGCPPGVADPCFMPNWLRDWVVGTAILSGALFVVGGGLVWVFRGAGARR